MFTGFDHNRNELRYANNVIQKIEERFDLVLLTDRMDESLLLLKGAFLRDIFVCVYISLNA